MYRLEEPVDNVQAMHVFQESSYSNQLSSRSTRGSITGRGHARKRVPVPTSPYNWSILQIVPEVEALHILIDETERVFLSRVNS